MEPGWVVILCGEFSKLSVCHVVDQLVGLIGKPVPDREILIVKLHFVTAIGRCDFANGLAVMERKQVAFHAVGRRENFDCESG